MGDPTLRFHMVEPPRGCSATSSAGAVTLRWDASTESALLGYHVYRAPSPSGTFTRLTASPLAATTFTDTTATVGLTYRYMVRTLKLETVPGGTYQNLSQGALATITVSAAATPAPFGPGNLSVQHLSSVQTVLTWTDNSADETGFRIERRVNSNPFSTLATVGPDATTFTVTGALQNVNVYYFRVVALGAGGASLPSDEVWVDAHPGYFDLGNPGRTKVNRAGGVAAMLVNRFGHRNGPAQVTGATSNVTAIAGTHYTAVSAPVAFANGENSTQIVNIALATGGPPMLPRQFNFTLSNPTIGASIAVQNLTRVLIEDSSATLPAPWQQTILGTVTDSSPAGYAEGAIGSAVAGGSATTADNGRFIYQARTGDGVLTTFIDTPLPALANARYCVMARGSNADDTVAAMAQMATSTVGTNLYARTATAGTLALAGSGPGLSTPRWVRLTRSGNTFEAETSSDNTTWSALGSTTVSAMPATANWGLFHFSDNSGNFQTARFRYTTLTAPGVVAAPGNFVITPQAPAQIQLTWDLVGGAAGYRLERRPRHGTFALLQTFGPGVSTFTDTAVVAGAVYDYRVMAFSGATDSAWTTSSAIAPGTPSAYTLWLELRGLPMDGSGQGAPLASPSGDGIANAIKFGLNINPFLSGYLGRLTHGLTSDGGQTYVSLTYIRPEPPPAGVTYRVRTGSDLLGWSAAETFEVSNVVTGSVRTITVRDTQPANEANPHRFIRLEVTLP
jgi:hypothetical protein